MCQAFREMRAGGGMGRIIPEIVGLAGVVRQVMEFAPVLFGIHGVAPLLGDDGPHAGGFLKTELRRAVVELHEDFVSVICALFPCMP